ncbi:hypothetical protein NONI108955_09740 [Nocardia ninae]|uniref:Uncharacterized protein n=1 Tax=Nocardia ninae NBRC 108245 TaxID=1210091 RepID=A0A511M864_9NOCA|nr:hypothetical protein [Nocardia ninae]GEM36771.1 hypothetical protein NN4_12900 [Nocardia ninae NBRC 108245]
MERGNSKHGPKLDDELAHELEGTIRGNRSSRAEEWRDPGPPADDDEITGDRPTRERNS